MNITALTARDFKGLRDIHIEPGERQLVVLEGKNGAGKSSVLDAALCALAGPKGEEVIRRGAETAEITVTIGDGGESYTIRRVFSADRATLEVRAADGRKMASPKATLDKLVGARFLDPMAFYALKGAERQQTFLRAAGIGDALDRLQEERREAFSERTAVNRQVRDAVGELEGLPAPVAGTPVDVAALHARRASVQQSEQEQAQRQRRVQDLLGEIDRVGQETARIHDEIARLQVRLGELAARRTEVSREHVHVAAAVEAYHPDSDWTLDEEIAQAEAHNRAVAQAEAVRAERERAAAKHARYVAESDRLTATIADIDARKVAALAAIDMPVDGLSMDDEGNLRMRGVLLDSLSDSEKLRLSLTVAAALQPELRDVFVSSGERLDADGWAAMRAFASDRGLRLWVERVGVGFDDAIVIEEGRVRGDNGGTL